VAFPNTGRRDVLSGAVARRAFGKCPTLSSVGEDVSWSELQDRARVRADAYLTVYSDTETPEQLAQAIGLEADDGWCKGQPRGRLKKPAPTNAVSYHSQLDDLQSPSEHVAALASRLRPYMAEIRSAASRESTTKVLVRVVEHTDFDNPEAWVEPADLETFAAMGVTLGFDTYVYLGDDETATDDVD
jgi:hypothetical protein